MRKIVLSMPVSLDAFIEGPDREIDWHLVDDELHRHFNEQLILHYRRARAASASRADPEPQLA